MTKTTKNKILNEHPLKGFLKLYANVWTNNISQALVLILLLIFAALFTGIRISHLPSGTTLTKSEIVTSLGLSQITFWLMNSFFISVAVFFSTSYSKLLQIGHRKKIEHYFGNAIFVLCIGVLLFAFLLAFAGRYIVYIQNLSLPQNYKHIIINNLYYQAGLAPFLAIIAFLFQAMAAENNVNIVAILGITRVVAFCAVSFILFYSGAFASTTHPALQISNVVGLSLLLATVITALVAICAYAIYRRLGRSYLFFHYKIFNEVRLKTIGHVLLKSLPILSRNLAIVISTLLINIILTFVPVNPTEGDWFSFNSSKPFFGEHRNTAVYWQFITASTAPLFSMAIAGMFAVSAVIRIKAGAYLIIKRKKEFLQIYKYGAITLLIYGIVLSVIVLSLTKYILLIFGIKNGGVYNFVTSDGSSHIITANVIGNQAVLITRLTFATALLLGPQILLAAYSLMTQQVLLTIIGFSTDKLLLEVPLFALFVYFAHSEGYSHYYVAWISYICSDVIAGILLGSLIVTILFGYITNRAIPRLGVKPIIEKEKVVYY